MKKIYFIFFFFLFYISYSQNRRKLDSLLTLSKNSPAKDTEAVKLYNTIAITFNKTNLDSSKFFCEKALVLSKRLKFKSGIANAYNSLGIYFRLTTGYDSALKYYTLASEIRKETGDKKAIITSQNNIAIIYSLQGNYNKAIDLHEKALALQKTIRDTIGAAYTCNYLANVFNYLADYEKALQYYEKARRIFEKRNNTTGLMQVYNNIGIVYGFIGNHDKAIEYYNLSLEVCEKTGDKKNATAALGNLGSAYQKKNEIELALKYYTQSLQAARSIGFTQAEAANLSSIGTVFQSKKDFVSALSNFKQVLQIHEKSGEKREIAQTNLRIGTLLLEQNKTDEAKACLDRSAAICKQLGVKDLLLENYSAFAGLYKRKKDFKKSYEYLGLYSELKDSVLNEEKSKNIALMQTRFDTEKKENEIASLTKDKAIGVLRESEQKANIRKQNIVLGISLTGVLLVLVLVFIILKGYRDKKKANSLLEEKNAAILAQKKILEEKNILVTDSIEYAKGIQETILPAIEEVLKWIPGCFIFYKPKDIVAGDFYWLKVGTKDEGRGASDDSVFLAACDCTGHGVPGAFMSMHSFYLLERIMKEKKLKSPAQILDELNFQMKDTLHQDKKDASAKYGIDMALIKIEKDTIEFAGARNALLVIKDKELTEIRADRIYIGGSKEKFTNNILQPEKGSMLYMFTDGYADQKGGKKSEKYFSTNFRELLKEISVFSPEEQKNKLESAFEEWRGSIEQIDDVLVIGVRI
ncbi:MAG: tetratricopeptide repeat protein [Bacteroidia bacterium]|nr:tetratricopeptide repeat protein [Bacteroidia bacterium]